MQTIICDTRQKLKHHEQKEQYFKEHGFNVLRTKLPCGDYAKLNDMSVVVDTKQDLQECINNICGKEHDRFRRECQLAKENGIKLIILVEQDGIGSMRDVRFWKNPRLDIYCYRTINGVRTRVRKYPKATKGITLMKAMLTMQLRYDVEFQFCNKADAGRRVLELLGVQDG